ncbi:hypothetical protein CC78DRAFT_534462 [Lojkania enalia]|uniref:C2H2-type domain-containing protein n=1 Tax=Lojkania enalia TaxID=147567 RepID=A0A9P4N1W5_9PLEO|nr:hypothetical protein CC78DRAFT_534462 [Didymosphaeria enalia]
MFATEIDLSPQSPETASALSPELTLLNHAQESLLGLPDDVWQNFVFQPSQTGGHPVSHRQSSIFDTISPQSAMADDAIPDDWDAEWDPPASQWDLDGYEEDFVSGQGTSAIPLSPFSLESLTESYSPWIGDGDMRTFMGFESHNGNVASGRDTSIPLFTSPITDYSAEDIAIPPFLGPEPWSALNLRAYCLPLPSQALSGMVLDEHLHGSSKPPKDRIKPYRQPRATIQNISSLSHCQECDRPFKLLKDLERHKHSVHSGVRQWFCSIPGCKFAIQGFTRKDKLTQHTRTHRRKGEAIARNRIIISESSSILESIKVQGVDQDTSTNWETTSDIVPIPMWREATASSYSEADFKTSLKDNKKVYRCSVNGCTSSFVNHYDLRRHAKTVHMDQDAGEGYRCAATGCAKTDKIWTRLDSFKKHLATQHIGQDLDELVRKSARLGRSVFVGFPITITTPDTFSRNIQQDLTSFHIQGRDHE